MRIPRIVVIDYGIGNVRSVCRAVESCGGTAVLSSNASEIVRAERLVVPGVGAFGSCVDALRQGELADPICQFISSGRPLLGICVGMQMLFESSEEFGSGKGLGIIRGCVKQIPTQDHDGRRRKIPHIGWAGIEPENDRGWVGTPLETILPGTNFYFVHSFSAHPTEPESLLAVIDHQGAKLTAAVQQGNVFGVQFHPEKSGNAGLQVFYRFLTQ
jgi:imidazole glycerol-phosphate synthase subunit HisH